MENDIGRHALPLGDPLLNQNLRFLVRQFEAGLLPMTSTLGITTVVAPD